VDGFGKGDQHIQILVKVPTKLSKRQKDLLQEFASLEGKDE
jgi:molecular chaperone DnaJ